MKNFIDDVRSFGFVCIVRYHLGEFVQNLGWKIIDFGKKIQG